jgi:SEC-C motif
MNNPLSSHSKIGRNSACPCGSGRKFKHCHGGPEFALPNLISQSKFQKKVIEEGKRLLERYKVKELQREIQQGLGRPIISTEHHGYRFVAVGNRMHYGKWQTFYDFLAEYIKLTLGGEWGNTEIAKPLADRHPIMQWYDKICHLQLTYVKEPGTTFSLPLTGACSAYYRLAYNLYLIAHNGRDIETRLIARLKNKGNFQGAFFETQVAAWLIRAGFALEFEDETDRSTSHCEFTATFIATSEKYSVEAKSRALNSHGSGRTPVGRQLRLALGKKANYKRVVFLDLNKPLHTLEAANRAANRAEQIIKFSEQIEIDGAPAPPAYVCITNMSDQYALDTASPATMVSFRGFKIEDFMGVEFLTIRDAVRARERHWPMFQLFKSIDGHREIPQTFDGELPSEMFFPNTLPRLQIGQFYRVPRPDGSEVDAKLVNATVMGAKAYCVFNAPKSKSSWIGTFDMTPEEIADYEKCPDIYFGVYQKQSRHIHTAIELFDFFFESYRDTPKEQLIRLLSEVPMAENVDSLTQKDLVEILAERYAMGMIANGFAVDSSRGRSRDSPLS